MTSLRDQFSAVRKAQFEAQFDFFNSMTAQALDSAGRLAALNLAVSRDAVQRSLGAGFTLMSSRDPRDVLVLGGQAEEQMRSLFAYGRELLGIASGMRPYALRPQALSLSPQQAVETVEVIERGVADTVAGAAAAVAGAAETAHAAAAAPAEPARTASIAPTSDAVVAVEPVKAPETAPEALAAVAEPVPVAEPKAIAKAVGKGAPRAAAAPHPAAAPLAADAAEPPKVAIPQVGSRRKK